MVITVRVIPEITSTPFHPSQPHEHPKPLNPYGSSPPRRLIRGMYSHKQMPPSGLISDRSDQPRTLTKDASHALQPQQPTRAQHAPTQIQPVAVSYQPSLPSGSEMPDEWGYPPLSMPQVSSVLFSCAWWTYPHDLWHRQTYR